MSYKKPFFTLSEAFYLTDLSYNSDFSIIQTALYSKATNVSVSKVAGGASGLNAVIYSRRVNSQNRYFLAVAGTSLPGKNQAKFTDLFRDISNVADLVLQRTPKQSYDLESFLLNFLASQKFEVIMDSGAHSLGCAVIAFVVAKHPSWFGKVSLIDGPGVQEIIEKIQPNIELRKEAYLKLSIYNGLPNLINTFNSHSEMSKIYCLDKIADKKIYILHWDLSAHLMLTSITHNLENLRISAEQNNIRRVDSSWYKDIDGHSEWPDSMLSKYKENLSSGDDIQVVHVDTGSVVGVIIEEDHEHCF